MVEGKLPENILVRSVLKEIKDQNNNVITGAAFGEDCAVLNLKGQIGVSVATSYRTSEAANSIYKASNNLYAKGYDFEYAFLAITIPNSFEEQDLKELIRLLKKTCDKLGASIPGGHTEVSHNESLSKDECIVSVTAMGGKNPQNTMSDKWDIHPGDSIIATKSVAIEATLKLLETKRETIAAHFNNSFLSYFEGLEKLLSVKEEGEIALANGAVAMKDVSEFGLFGALWELGSLAGLGLTIDSKAIPVRQEIIEVFNLFDINPYEAKSSGMLLIVTKDPDDMLEALNQANIEAVCIGHFTDNNDRVVVNGEEIRHLEKIKQDAIYKIKEI